MRSKSFLASMLAYVKSCFCIAADQYGDREGQYGDGFDEDESPLAAESDATATQRLRDEPADEPAMDLLELCVNGDVDAARLLLENGAEVGATIGGLGGFLAGFATITLPGAGPLLVLGTALVTAIAGISVGALAGGTIGLLVQLGFNEDIAKQIEKRLESGQTLVAVQAETVDQQTLRDIMLRHQPNEIMEKQPFATASTQL